jgi:hypothetical protein
MAHGGVYGVRRRNMASTVSTASIRQFLAPQRHAGGHKVKPQAGPKFGWCGSVATFNTSATTAFANEKPSRWWCACGMAEKTRPCGLIPQQWLRFASPLSLWLLG